MSDHFDALIAELTANPELANTLDMPVEELAALAAKINPYDSIAGPPRNEQIPRVAATSFTNMRVDYIRKYTMTSIVGYLFRMMGEWTVPDSSRRWTPKTPEGVKTPYTSADVAALSNSLATLSNALNDAERVLAETTAAYEKYVAEHLVFSEEEMPGVEAATERMRDEKIELTAEEKSTPLYLAYTESAKLRADMRKAAVSVAGIRYVTTLEMRNTGISADTRMPETEAEAFKFPEAKSVIEQEADRYKGTLPGGMVEISPKAASNIIKEFLCNHFEYNPDAHVRKAYDEVNLTSEDVDLGLSAAVPVDPHDPGRIPLRTLLCDHPPTTTVSSDIDHLKAFSNSQGMYNALCRVLTDPICADTAKYVLEESDADPNRLDRWRTMLVPKVCKDAGLDATTPPPQDTFHRWSFYDSVNMEALRSMTNTLYHEKDDLDYAIHLMEYHEGTPDDVKKWGESFRDKWQDRVISDIKMIEFGQWTVLGDFERNRSKINIYNKHTQIIERIFKRLDEDKNLGEALMRQRVLTTKAANIAKDGPDAKSLKMYKSTQASLPGVRDVIAPEDRARLEKAKGNIAAARELRYLEENENALAKLESESRTRELTAPEKFQMKTATENIAKAKEMFAVPVDAIKVDVFNTTYDPKVVCPEGNIEKSSFYSAADMPGEERDTARAAANIKIAKTIAEKLA